MKPENLSSCKRYIFCLMIPAFLFVFAGNIHSQDILRLKSGKEIRVNIIEESTDIIKYRDYGQSSGPLYSITRDKVESVKYDKNSPLEAKSDEKPKTKPKAGVSSDSSALTTKNRYVLQNGKTLSTRQIKLIMEDYPEALDLYTSGHKMCNMSNACAASIVLTSFIAGQVSKNDDGTSNKAILAAGLGVDAAFLVAGIVLASKGKQKIRKSVSLYNSQSGLKADAGMRLYAGPGGIGFAVRF